MLYSLRLYLLACVSALIVTSAAAQIAPLGPVILEVRSENATDATQEVKKFDRNMLEDIGLFSVVTKTPWTSGLIEFEGVLVRDLMHSLDAKANTLVATALNDYKVSIPAADYETYDVIIATRRNGSFLTVRDKGPLWIIYPFSDNPILNSELYYSRSIWQLKAIGVTTD